MVALLRAYKFIYKNIAIDKYTYASSYPRLISVTRRYRYVKRIYINMIINIYNMI